MNSEKKYLELLIELRDSPSIEKAGLSKIEQRAQSINQRANDNYDSVVQLCSSVEVKIREVETEISVLMEKMGVGESQKTLLPEKLKITDLQQELNSLSKWLVDAEAKYSSLERTRARLQASRQNVVQESEKQLKSPNNNTKLLVGVICVIVLAVILLSILFI